MKRMGTTICGLALVFTIGLTSCATTDTSTTTWTDPNAAAQWARPGRVEAVQEVVQRTEGNPVGGENPAAAFAQIAASALDRALDPLLASCNPLRFGVQFREFLLRDAAQPCRKRRVIGEAVQQRLLIGGAVALDAIVADRPRIGGGAGRGCHPAGCAL